MFTLFSVSSQRFIGKTRSQLARLLLGSSRRCSMRGKELGTEHGYSKCPASLTRALTQWGQDGDNTSLRQGKAGIQASTQKIHSQVTGERAKDQNGDETSYNTDWSQGSKAGQKAAYDAGLRFIQATRARENGAPAVWAWGPARKFSL